MNPKNGLRSACLVLALFSPTSCLADVLTAEAEQALKPKDTFRECAKDCPEMVVVPAGKFMMGSPEGQGDDDEHPQHEVTFDKPFAVSKFEVTFDDWDACVAMAIAAACQRQRLGARPATVINVTWDDAKGYVAWLSRMTGKTYRLLTEAEWEYAARAGTQPPPTPSAMTKTRWRNMHGTADNSDV